jgi:uncharacterized protein (DUF58 family)
MSELADRPLRVPRESILLHWLRLFIWFSNLRLVPRWYEHRAKLSRRLLRTLYWDGMTRIGKVLFICCVLIFLASYRTNSEYQLLTAGWGLALLLWSAILGVVYRPQLRLDRDTPNTVVAGQPLRSSITVTNTGPRTLHNFTLREMVVPDGRWPREWQWPHQVRLAAGESCQLSVMCWAKRRGVFELGGIAVQSYFPFFLTRVTQRVDLPTAVYVLPPVLPVVIPSLRKLAEQASKRLAASGNKARQGPALDYSHSREYQTGDSLRRLDHRAGSRLGKPMSKIFAGVDEIRRDEVYLMIDCSLADFKRWQRRPEDDEPLDERLALAVEIGLSAQNEGFSLAGLSTAADWQAVDTIEDFYRSIASCHPRKTAEQSMQQNARLLPESYAEEHGVHILVTGRWTSEAEAKVRQWQHEGVLVLVFLIAERPMDTGSLPAGEQFFEITLQREKTKPPLYLRLRQSLLNRSYRTLESVIRRLGGDRKQENQL